MLKGLILKSTGSWYTVQLESGECVEARLKGKIRLQGIKSTNPVAVGDEVVLVYQEKDKVYQILDVLPRKNYLIRRAANLSKQTHIIAANIDMLYVVFTVENPKTTHTFLDRILVMAEAFDVPCSIVFNKMDTYSDDALEEVKLMQYCYQQMGYPCYAVSAKTGLGLDAFKAALVGKVNAITGHSGVGKSTLINAIEPGLNLKTADISGMYKVGKHTTTFAEMLPLKMGGYFIDSPGIKGFGLTGLDKTELPLYFRDMKALLDQCKFYNCRHLEEPGCAVQAALEAGKLAPWRYISYLNMYNEDDQNPHRIMNYEE